MFIRDLRYSVRVIIKSPAFAIVAVITLAIGIGANTAIFSVVNAVLLRPLPYPQPERLTMVWDANPQLGRDSAGPSPGNFLDWRERNEVFDSIAAWYKNSQTVSGDHEAEQLNSASVSEDFFKVAGTRPLLGRVFLPDEVRGASFNVADQYSSGDRLVVISHRLWQRRYGANPDVVGRKITLNSSDWEVVGVMPQDFALPDAEVDMWVLWDIAASYDQRRFPKGVPRDFRFLRVIARLKSAITPKQAQSNMAAIAADLAERFPDDNLGWGVRLTPLYEDMVTGSRPALLVLFAAVAFVLAVACANVASLLLARASVRQREIAIRLSLGASRSHITRQLLIESLLLATAGGLLGLLITYLGLDLLISLAPVSVPRIAEASIDGGVLAFTLFVTVITGLVFGVVPAWQSAKADLSSALKEADTRSSTAGASHNRIRNLLVTGEVAIALILLVGAGLFTRSFERVIETDPGFDTENLLAARISLNRGAYRTRQQSSLYYETFIERLSLLPSVLSVSATTVLPMSEVGVDFDRPYWREGEPDPGGEARQVGIRMATPDYLKTIGLPLEKGRWITKDDRLDRPRVIVINEALAREAWSEEDAVGKRLIIDYLGGKYPYEIVGVVGDARYYGLKREAAPELFIPHAQNPYLAMNVVIKTSSDPSRLADAIRREALSIDPTQPVHSVITMEAMIDRWVSPDRFSMLLLGLLASIAMALAASGVYATLMYRVSRRTHEIGVRMALGASRADVFKLVFTDSMKLVLAGLILGLAGALVLTRVIAGLLYNVSPIDGATFLTVPLILASVALIASYLPARRAMQVEPTVALRQE